MAQPQLELQGLTLYIDGNPRQISQEDTIYCPLCRTEILYWQTTQHYARQHDTESEN